MKILISEATIITMNPAKQVLPTAGLLMDGDRISWLGEMSSLPAIQGEWMQIPAKGKVILPGFVNLHTHAALSILRGIGDDLGVAPAYSPDVPQGVFLSPEDIYVFSLLGGLEALKFGTTCLVDNYIFEHEAARAFDQLGMRASVSERLHDADLLLIPAGKYEFDDARGDELLERGIELCRAWEGAGNGRITTRIGPHASDTCSTKYLKKLAKVSEALNVGQVLHVAQSRRELEHIRERSGLTVVEYLDQNGLLGSNLIAGHCVFIDNNEKRLLKSTDTHVSHQSGSNAKGGMMAPIKDLLDMGVNIGLGTDNMSGDMVEVLRLAVCIARMREDDPQALRAIDVLEMATMGGARALGLQDEIGSIEVGKKADIIVMDFNQTHLVPVRDPVANLVHNGLGSDVDMVFVDGELLIKNGQSTRVDEQSILDEAQARSNALWKKMGY
ncbi:MAG TPA: amidohydrolase [Anaerolineales bacterium]|nr:amidohydrolase [Anaerolineales bacterium]